MADDRRNVTLLVAARLPGDGEKASRPATRKPVCVNHRLAVEGTNVQRHASVGQEGRAPPLQLSG